MQPVNQGGSLKVTATIAFGIGRAPGNNSGPQTVGNSPSNDNSTTNVKVTGPLPVTLVSFDARKEGRAVQLQWATTEETNSDYFEVQRSTTGKQWTVIGQLSSHRESNQLQQYTFTDPQPLNGGNLYRLRMVDLDRTFAYSSIRNVSLEGNFDMYVYPNPVDKRLYMSANSVGDIKQLQLFNIAGRRVLTSDQVQDGVDVQALNSGIYMLKIETKNGTVKNSKIIVAH